MLIQNNKEIALQLLVESIITVGTYKPSKEFLSSDSIGITLNGEPILLLGYADDAESIDITDRLLDNKDFRELVEYVFGSSENLSKAAMSNSQTCPNPEYSCITKSVQGMEEDGSGTGDLVAVLPIERAAFACCLCINSKIMQCFYPSAKPLSKQVVLN